MYRFAEITTTADADVKTVRAYLPGNYRVLYATDERIIISGEDSCGWTLDDYVIPRLASGFIFAFEISASEVPVNRGNSVGFDV